MMRSVVALCAVSALVGWTTSATAEECPGHPDALGTERVIAVDPTEHPRIGTMQYPESLPLADKEVVLTFDDGPLPTYTSRILETLASECVKATFFMVGRMANTYPAMARRVYNEGHTVASHSQTHPLIFTRLSAGAARAEIDQGANSVATALGDPRALAPFFRFPGLGRSKAIESYLASRGMMTWSADFPADDWTHISGKEVMKRALERLEHRGRGVLLLHDIQPATALMLPQLLRELKARGYHVVQVVPTGPNRPKTLSEPEAWVMHKPKPVWPAVLDHSPVTHLAAPSVQTFGWPHPFGTRLIAPMPVPPALVAALAEDLPAPVHLPPWSPATADSNDDHDEFGPLATTSGDPLQSLAVSEDMIASMIAPPLAPPAPRPKPRATKLRPPPVPVPRPLATLPAAPPPKVVSRFQTLLDLRFSDD